MKKSPWSDYFKNTIDKEPNETLVFAAKLIKDQPNKCALDIGSGTGSDALHLLEQGFKVTALDQEKNSIDIIKNKVSKKLKKSLTLEHTFMQNFTITNNSYNLINATFSLPFCKKSDFIKIWDDIYKGLKSNGVFSGQIFGENDDWANIQEMSFFTNEEIDDLIVNYIPEYYKEVDEKGLIADGSEKHWHLFNIVLRKI
ncbi:MAG: class I SAM-dependent methyltransferase [Spirochaetaceae bacterium]